MMSIEEQILFQESRVSRVAKQILDLQTLLSMEKAHLSNLYKRMADRDACIHAVVNTQAPKQIKPSIIVVDIPKAKLSVPNAVHVNWSRGHSGASYPVLAHGISQIAKHEGERYYVVNISTDPSKAFPKRVWEADCKAAVVKVEAVVAEKAA